MFECGDLARQQIQSLSQRLIGFSRRELTNGFDAQEHAAGQQFRPLRSGQIRLDGQQAGLGNFSLLLRQALLTLRLRRILPRLRCVKVALASIFVRSLRILPGKLLLFLCVSWPLPPPPSGLSVPPASR